jgi:hypothetical protein
MGELPVTRTILAALLATAGLCGVAQAQSRPMPTYQDDESYGQPTASDDNASSRDARHDAGYPRGYGDPPTVGHDGRQNDYPGYADAPQGSDDEAHRADRRRTAELNQRAAARPRPAVSAQTRSDYSEQSAQYRAELADHARAMQDYNDERARYAERIAHWRARADACEAGDPAACNGPE